MKPGQLEELLRYRLEQAHETLRESEILLGEAALLHSSGYLTAKK